MLGGGASMASQSTKIYYTTPPLEGFKSTLRHSYPGDVELVKELLDSVAVEGLSRKSKVPS